VHPNQLLLSETDVMKKLLNDPDLRFWPLRSVYYHALRKKWVSMSLSTWYCYAKLLGVVRLKPRSVKKYEMGIRANQPNEYWHADVSIFKTADGIKHYIYTVVDNFSRFPLTIKVSTKLSGAIRVETFRDAVRKALTIHPTIETVNLIVDGGSENFNGTVDEFLERLDDIEIRRINALKDVAYSNSMAEALNRIIKCSYLNQMNNENTAALEENMKLTEDNYALIRPHAALKGLTPLEAYSGKRPDEISYTPQLKEARKKRIEMNKKYNCGSCRF
jgi:putative transposase